MAIATLLDEAWRMARREVMARQALEAGSAPAERGVRHRHLARGRDKVTTEALAARGQLALGPRSSRSGEVRRGGRGRRRDPHRGAGPELVPYRRLPVAHPRGRALAAAIRGSRTDDLAVRAILDITDDARPASDVAAGLAGVDRVLVVGPARRRHGARSLP
jgi:hypothetical protein